MTRPLPRVGKLDPGTFDEVIFPRLGRGDSSVILGPRHGVDAAVVDLGDRVMVVAEDPTFGLASWGWRRFGWGVVHICAGDVAVMGVKPQYMTICLLLPPATPRGSWRRSGRRSTRNATAWASPSSAGTRGPTGAFPTC